MGRNKENLSERNEAYLHFGPIIVQASSKEGKMEETSRKKRVADFFCDSEKMIRSGKEQWFSNAECLG
jgi:hypothetical protein